MLRASYRIRKLALPQGMLPRQNAIRTMRSTASANAQPLEKLEAEYEEPTSHQHASPMREPPEAGPSNYFTASRPSSSSSASTTTSHAHYFPSPSTPESPFSAFSLASAFPQSHLHPSDASDPAAPRAISADQLHLNVIWHHINLPKEERDQHVATATWRRWQRLSPATKRYLSRQMHQQVLRGVVPSVDHMRPYIEAVRRQSEPAPEDARFGKQKEKQKAGESRGKEGGSLNTLPDIGHRFRSVLEEMDNLAVLKPASHAPGSSPWDYRFTLLYLARIGDSPSAEKIADTMRHRGVPLNIRHVDARLVALVRYLEKSRHRKRSMSGQEVDAVVDTLWKILGDMNTHMERDSVKLGGAAKRPREITMMMLLQAINLARRIFARAANAAAATTDSAASSAASASAPSTSSSSTRTASASASAPLLPLGNPSSPTSDKALELDRLLEEVLLKGYNLDLRHATYKTPLYDAQGQEVKRARMNGVVLLAMVDHFGRQGEVWKMISVLHAYGETKAWDGLAGVVEQAETGKRNGVAEVVEEEEAVGLEEMMRRENEGRKGMDMFGRTRVSSSVSVESSTAVEGAAETFSSAAGSPVSAAAIPATASRISAPSTRLFDTFYPSIPVSPTFTASANTVAPLGPEHDVDVDRNPEIDTSYDASFQRTDIYTTALQHALRKDDWAVSLHLLSTAITASREVRAQWLAARWARERQRAALYQGATTTAQEASAIPAAADFAAHADINAQLPAIPYPRISIHPEWFLRTHIRMTRYRAGAKHFAKLQDLLRRAMGDVRDEARALAAMEGWSGNVSKNADADAEVEAEAGAEAGISHVDGYEYWARDMAELERLDEVVMGRSKEGAEVWKVVQAQAQAQGEEEGEGLEGREVSPHIPSPAFTATAPVDHITPQTTIETTSSAPASPSMRLAQTPQLSHTHPSAPPSHHLLSTLGTHASLRSILAYSLHRKTLAHGVRARSNLRFEANQMVRKERREEEERERAEKRERGRAGARRKGKKQEQEQEQGTVEGAMGEGGGRIVGSDGTMAAMA